MVTNSVASLSPFVQVQLPPSLLMDYEPVRATLSFDKPPR